ncbi:hypothetical protein DL96DRAFT_1685274 [Flagelloscypha sp. PMI_526]|nr:hypothetical protein DL96DRAFT_1685274 [Flagelloscypha sp. PMI_526]
MSWTELPQELFVPIFTFAAELSDKKTLVALTRVSKRIQNIADRVLFEDILFGQRRKTTLMLKQMLSLSCTSARLLRARTYVRSFRSLIHWDMESDSNLHPLHCFPNLELLAYTNTRRSTTYWVQPPTALRTIGIARVHVPQDLLVNLCSAPLFQNLTHLVIEEIETEDIRPLLFQETKVTHMYLGCNVRSNFPWAGPTSLSPQLRLCLVYFGLFERGMSDERFHKIIEDSPLSGIEAGKVDIRIVPVIPVQRVNWTGRTTCRGFLVGPDLDENPSEIYPGAYPDEFKDRKPLYDWVSQAWAEGEEIVRQREKR